MTTGWILLFLQIMLINLVLSGDNAIVIALASRNLPKEDRRRAIWWGAFGAVMLRIALTVIAVTLLGMPYIKIGGGLLLLYIAVKLLMDGGGHNEVREAATLPKAVVIIIAADFIMSLDNVLAVAAAADNNFNAVIIGIALSIPLIIWGSSLVTRLLQRFPILVQIGAAILGYTAGEMLVTDKVLAPLLVPEGSVVTYLPYVLAVFVIVVGLLLARSPFSHSDKRH
jgi:YjbE family integral membrane protein